MLVQVAERLRELSHCPVFFLWEKGPEKFLKDMGFEVVVSRDFRFNTYDLFLVPEGWPNVLALSMKAGIRNFVYCQNWAYLFSGLPQGVSWHDLPVEFISVSDPVRVFIRKSLNRNTPVIRPAIDDQIFYPPESKPRDRIYIAYMPRKNKALYRQIRRIFQERNKDLEVSWVSIEGVPPDQVAGHLRKSHVFLATGFPEGIGLPPLEAMACGCFVTGFAGLGGWDYMRQAGSGYVPDIPLRQVAWQGNGFYSADYDVLDAALKLEAAVRLYRDRDLGLEGLLEQSRLTVRAYSKENQQNELSRWIRTVN